MFSQDRWQEIFETLRKNKLRTILSGFTVALGIFIFVILFGFGNGLKNSFNEFFIDDATNVFFISANRTTKPYRGYKSNRKIQFRNDDLSDIQRNFSHYIEYITPRVFTGAMTRYKNEANNYSIRAVAPSHQYSEKTVIMQGRYLNEIDIRERRKHAVIGRLVEQDLFKDTSAVGKFIDLGGSVYRVVGVFSDEGGDNEERYIYTPYTTRQLQDGNNDKISQIIVAFKPEIGFMAALSFQRQLDQFLREKHHISPEDGGGIRIRNIADDFQQNQQFASVLQIIVTFVGLGTLLAGIIGISNIMVFVVKERTKELGIRKALGATPSEVVGMILQESIVITTIAGYVGMLAGVLLLNYTGDKLEHYFISDPFINLGTALFATAVLIFFGAAAGYLPAKRAAKIKPIVALRDD